MAVVNSSGKQRRHLEAVTGWADKARRSLSPILERHGDRVHFRPASKGIAMIRLLPDRPQRGKSGFRDLERVAKDFEFLFTKYCGDIPQGRVTGEKALQSFLISEAYRNDRKLASINAASRETDNPVELVFVTDEIPLPLDEGKIVCDILALRRDGAQSTPVLIELKDSRMLRRLVEQVDDYAALMNQHPEAFERLFEAVLGEPICFDRPPEKWIVWPSAGKKTDVKEGELAARGIRVVGYDVDAARYSFRVGPEPAPSGLASAIGRANSTVPKIVTWKHAP